MTTQTLDVECKVHIVASPETVCSFGWQGHHVVSLDSTQVEVWCAEEGDGALLTLRHHGLPADEQDMHKAGRDFYLERLTIAATDGNPGPHAKPDM